MALQIHLNARVVPNFQWRGNGHHRRQYREQQPPIPVRVDGEQPFRRGRHHERDASKLQTNTGEQRKQLPRHFRLPRQPQKVSRNIQEGEWSEVPQILFIRDRLAHQSAEQARRGRRRHAEPLVSHQRGNSDDRATNGTYDAATEQAHQERAFQRQIGEPVRKSHHPQRHTDNQGRRREQHQLQLLVGIALFGEQHAAKRVPPRQQRGKRSGYAYFEQQREQQILGGNRRIGNRRINHGIVKPAAREPFETLGNMLITLANRQADVKRSEN